jgi:hypothetical protein
MAYYILMMTTREKVISSFVIFSFDNLKCSFIENMSSKMLFLLLYFEWEEIFCLDFVVCRIQKIKAIIVLP